MLEDYYYRVALLVFADVALAFLGEIQFIREGTIINAILIGQYIRLYFFLYKKMSAGKNAPETGTLEPASK